MTSNVSSCLRFCDSKLNNISNIVMFVIMPSPCSLMKIRKGKKQMYVFLHTIQSDFVQTEF